MFKTLKNLDYHYKLIEALFKVKVGAMVANFIAPLFIIFVLYDYVPLSILAVWFLLQMIVMLVRMKLSYSGEVILRKGDKKEIKKHLIKYLIAIFLNAFFVGISISMSIIYADVGHTLLLVVALFILMTGAISTLGIVFHAIFIFSSSIIFFIILSFLVFANDEIYNLYIFLLIIYWFVSIPASYKLYKIININIRQADVLREKNSNFESLFDSTMEAIIISDENHLIINANRAGYQLFAVKDESNFLNTSMINYVAEHERIKLQDALTNEKEEPRFYDLLKQDGTVFPTVASGLNMMMEGKKVRVSVIMDLTKVKEQEQQIVQQSRLAQMGEMISMIAHQWRQPLSAISSIGIDLQMKSEFKFYDLSTQEGREENSVYLEESLNQLGLLVQNLSTTIDDFRNFYRPGKTREVICVNKIVSQSYKIIRASIKANDIECYEELLSSVPKEVFSNELMQVILNLLKNASDALVSSDVQDPKIFIKTYDTRTSTIIEIEDNGEGITQEIREKIFNPYFSTKDEKNGTGLGLYMAKKIVEEHHEGELSVSSSENSTIFKIELF